MYKIKLFKVFVISIFLLVFLFFYKISYGCQFATDSSINNTELNPDLIERKILIEIPLWVPGYKGSFSYGNITIDGEGQNGDFLSRIFNSDLGLEFYFVGKLGYSLNKWNIQTDVFGGQLRYSVDFKYNNTNLIDAEIFTIIPRLYISYKLFDWEFKKIQNSDLKVLIYGGVRYYYVNINAAIITDISELKIKRSWTDPIIGYTVPFKISKWTILLQNDFGGFGIGSEFSWWLQLNCRYQIGNRFSFVAGWVIQDINYKEDISLNQFVFNARLNGPMAGITLHFW